MKRCLAIFILIILGLVPSVYGDYDKGLLVYGTLDSTRPFGFGFYNSTWSPFTTSPLKRPVTSLRLASHAVDSTHPEMSTIFAYGDIQFYGDSPVGGLLKYNIPKNSTTSFGKGVYADNLDLAHFLPVLGALFVVGGNLTIPGNDITNPYNIAYCLSTSTSCDSLSSGLPDYRSGVGIAGVYNDIYVAYISVYSQMLVKYYDWELQDWKQILGVVPKQIPSPGYAMAAFGPYVFLGGNFFFETVPEAITNLGYYDSAMGKWTPILINEMAPPPVTSVGVDTYNGDLYFITQTLHLTYEIYVYNMENSTDVSFNIMDICGFGIGPQIAAYQGNVVVQCFALGSFGAAILQGGTTTWQLLNNTFCGFDFPLNFIINNENLWFGCKTDTAVELIKYPLVDLSPPLAVKYTNLYGRPQFIQAFCPFGDNFFISGDFSSVGDLVTPQNAAIWNGTDWRLVQIKDAPVISECPFCLDCRASALTGVLFLAYLSNQVNNLTLAMINPVDFSVTYTSPAILENQTEQILSVSIVESRYVYVMTLGNLPYIYDSHTETWNISQWPTGFVDHNPQIWSVENNGTVLYIAGSFVVPNVDQWVPANVAKINLTTMEWMLMVEISSPSGIISSIRFTDQAPFAPMYVGGQFSFSYENIAFGNVAGGDGTIWNDNLRNTFTIGAVCNLHFDPTNSYLYILWHPVNCTKPIAAPYLSLASYDPSSAVVVPLSDQILGADVGSMYVPNVSIDSSSSAGRDVSKAVILFVVLGIVLFGLSVAVGFFIRYKVDQKRRYIEIPEYSRLDVVDNFSVMVGDAKIKKIEESEIEFGRMLGSGGFGLVYRAVYRNRDVAAKSIEVNEEGMVADFLKEIKLMSSVRHKNIVEFIGIMISPSSNKIWLITELMDSDLRKVMPTLKGINKWRISKDICNAMNYLHSLVPPVLYRDLKPSNVLINKKGRAKLTDFGISRLKPRETTIITQYAGTLCYVAPEVLIEARYNEKADVYSFGILLAELVTGRNPFHDVEFSFTFEFINKFKGNKIILDLPKTDTFPESICALVERCVSWIPSNRPSFSELVQLLKKNQSDFDKV